MNYQDVKITTTSSFEGNEIIEYLEPVTAHVVVGMNFFKDIFTGLSDFFGGNSKTYQDTLTSINEEVLSELKRKAYFLGGNCVLSLKIDNDEISSKGKSMMMVTALGTVAKANFNDRDMIKIIDKKEISSEFLKTLYIKDKYMVEIKNNDFKYDEDFWKFIKKNKFHEFGNFILSYYTNEKIKNTEYESDLLLWLKQNVLEYFSVIDSVSAIEILYDFFKKQEDKFIQKNIFEIIKNVDLLIINRYRNF